MALIEAINISHSFGDKILYKNASFELFKGEHMGIVGPNGAGKTTLLNSLSGIIIPDKGEVRVQNNIKLGYLDQHAHINPEVSVFNYLKTAFNELYDIEHELTKIYENMASNSSEDAMQRASDYQSLLVNRGFYEIESTVLKVADGLGITAFGMDTPIKKLSGGQRAKVILAKLLLEEPDVLLLDEPTNFLDCEHVQWLTDYLKKFKGAFVVVSHDFKFLNSITTCICDINFGNIKKYTGNFDKFKKSKELGAASYERMFSAQQKEIKKLETYIAKNKVRASTAKMAQSRQKRLDKMEKLDPPTAPPKPHFDFRPLPVSAGKALVVKRLSIGYKKKLLPEITFQMKGGEKLVITGFNGIGKSTLLKTIIGKIPALGGYCWFFEGAKIGYFEQDLLWEDASKTPLQIVSEAFPKLSQKDVRAKLARCGINAKDVMQSVRSLSGGEQAKTKMCLLTLTDCNFLILDEPTNHLDILAKEALARALEKWPGNMILVSHEPEFYRGWCKKIVNIENMNSK